MSAIIDKLLGTSSDGKDIIELGEIGTFIRGVTYSTEDLVEKNGIIVVRANNLSNGAAVNISNELVRINKKISDSQMLVDGDIVICMANGSTALVGKASYYKESPNNTITFGAFCGTYRSNKKIVRWMMQTRKYKHAISKCIIAKTKRATF